jgi:hypothetical protein
MSRRPSHACSMCRVVGQQAQSYWLYNVPWSISRMLNYMAVRTQITPRELPRAPKSCSCPQRAPYTTTHA